jgi:hypothetical protein
MEYNYYHVKGGRAKEILDAFFEERKIANKARTEFGERFGATGFYGSDRSITALKIQGGCPDGWKQEAHGYYSPKGSSKEAKAIREEMRELRIPGIEDLEQRFGLGWGAFMKLPKIYHLSIETIAGDYYIGVPDIEASGARGSERYKPLDEFTVPIPRSQYWAAKEAEPKEEEED